MTCTSSVSLDRIVPDTEADDWRLMLRADIEEGLRAGRWTCLRSIALDLSEDYADDIMHLDVKRVIRDAEREDAWPEGWAQQRMNDAHALSVTQEGSRTPRLTEAQVRELRRRWSLKNRHGTKASTAELAAEFGISRTQVLRIGRGLQWRHLT